MKVKVFAVSWENALLLMSNDCSECTLNYVYYTHIANKCKIAPQLTGLIIISKLKLGEIDKLARYV